jgi:hypothetical protein
MLNAETDEIKKRADQKAKDFEIQKIDLLKEIAKLRLANTMQHTKQDILSWLKIFTRGDILSPEYQRRIIDIFVNSIYLFDDKIIIYYNLEGSKQVSFIEMLENIEDIENITPETDMNDNSENLNCVLFSIAIPRHF